MPQTFRIPFPAAEPDQLRFPERCICCGAPPQENSTLVITRLVKRKRKQLIETLHYSVPHCERCFKGTKAVFLASLLPFAAGFILLGGAAFLAAVFYTSELGVDLNTTPGTNNSFILGGAAGLLMGFLGGFIVEGLFRLILLPFYGRALWQAPLLAVQFIRDADYIAGLHGKLTPEDDYLQLTINNDNLAQEFANLNPQAKLQPR